MIIILISNILVMSTQINTVLNPNTISRRFYDCFITSLKPAFKTIRWLLSIMIPVSFAVMLLDWSGFLFWLAGYTGPLMKFLGLRGESALVLLSSGLLNIYSALATIQTLTLTGREITILALMCLISHNLIVETAVQKKTGSSALWMVVLRISTAIVGGFLMNLVLPGQPVVSTGRVLVHHAVPFLDMLKPWFLSTLWLICKAIMIIIGLNFLQRVMDEFSVTLWLSNLMSPVLKLFGLPPQASFMWLIANIIGLAWGSTILIEQAEQGKISQQEANLLNHHIAISHSLLEDTLLFVAIGVAAGWIIFPRLFLAFIAVWTYRLFFIKH